MSRSHSPPKKPTVLLALVCLALIKRVRPAWVAITVQQAARDEHISAERISRLCSRAIDPFATLIAQCSQLGRPPADRPEQALRRQLLLTQALLCVCTQILKSLPLRKPAVRSLIVGSYLRLKAAHPQLTQTTFCDTLGIGKRTLRHWLASGLPDDPMPAVTPSVAPVLPKRRQRRGRFGFDVTVPDTQMAADTTDITAFGCDLKLIAAQDVGARDQDLLDAVIVDEQQNADLVVKVISEAIGDRQGMQLIVDQGTPYLAEKTQAACDQLGAELAVQREGHPQGKATLERAFCSVKHIAQPILALTDRIAGALPQLRCSSLAKAATTLLLTALLRAYQAGARAAVRADAQRAGCDAQTLSQVAANARMRARADDHSIRLLLTHIHSAYQIDVGIQRFIKTFRRFSVPVLHAAERAFAKQAHRDDIKKRTSYFAAIVRAESDRYLAQRARLQHDQALLQKLHADSQQAIDQHNAWLQNPTAWLRYALDTLALQWLPEHRRLFCDGRGIGLAALRSALERLVQLHGLPATEHIAHAVAIDFERAHLDRLGPDGLAAIRTLLTDRLAALSESVNPSAEIRDCLADFRAAILPSAGPNKHRPPPPAPLRT